MLCIIVGAGPGLGAAVAARFVAGGFDVALIGRRAEALASLATRLGPNVQGFAADASDGGELTSALDAAAAWAGPADALIYNAALMEADAALPDAARVEGAMRTTLGGAITAVTHVLPAMRAAGRGTILLTGGGLALEPYPEWATLAAGKAALRSMALAWHKALLPEGIHVATIAVAGIVEPGGPFDPAAVADVYWGLYAQPPGRAQREVVYLPGGSDPFYNDPEGTHRATSLPVVGVPLNPSDPSAAADSGE